MTRGRWIGAALGLLALVTLWSAFYSVQETELAARNVLWR